MSVDVLGGEKIVSGGLTLVNPDAYTKVYPNVYGLEWMVDWNGL